MRAVAGRAFVRRLIAAFTVVVVPASIFLLARNSPSAAPGSTARPNIVVIMADDLDSASLNRMIGAGLMPNLVTYLSSRGTTFLNSFVTNPVCCPSRATFLTGQYSHNSGVRTNYDPGGAIRALDDGSTVATWLQSAGYRTSFVGKYLNGYGSLDVNKDGVRDLNDIRYIPPGWTDWQALFDPTTYRMFHYAVNDNGNFVVYGSNPDEYQTDVLARRAARFIAASDVADDAAPFLLVVMPTAPHVEVTPDFTLKQYSDIWRFTIRPAPRHAGTVTFGLAGPPSFNEADVSDKPAWLRNDRPILTDVDQAYARHKYQTRAAAMRAVDDLIGTIANQLIASGELDNTILMFSSDNGYHLGEHRLGEKLDPYEESIRVPLFVAGPGVSTQSLAQMVANHDLAPTLADLAGATPGLAVDGRSFRPLLGDGSLAWRKRILLEHWDALDSTICLEFPASCRVLDLPAYAGLRTASTAKYTPSLTYVEYVDGSIELYDLATDPYQLVSLHTDMSEMRIFQRSVLSQWVAALKTCRDGTCQTYEFQ